MFDVFMKYHFRYYVESGSQSFQQYCISQERKKFNSAGHCFLCFISFLPCGFASGVNLIKLLFLRILRKDKISQSCPIFMSQSRAYPSEVLYRAPHKGQSYSQMLDQPEKHASQKRTSLFCFLPTMKKESFKTLIPVVIK